MKQDKSLEEFREEWKKELWSELKKENNDYVLGYRNQKAWEEYIKKKVEYLETHLYKSIQKTKTIKAKTIEDVWGGIESECDINNDGNTVLSTMELRDILDKLKDDIRSVDVKMNDYGRL